MTVLRVTDSRLSSWLQAAYASHSLFASDSECRRMQADWQAAGVASWKPRRYIACITLVTQEGVTAKDDVRGVAVGTG